VVDGLENIANSSLKDITGDNETHNFTGTFEDSVDSLISEMSFDFGLVHVSITTVELKADIGEVKALLGSKNLSHRAQHASVGVELVDLSSSFSDNESRSNEISCAFSEFELSVLERSDGLTELLAVLDVFFSFSKAPSCRTKRCRCDIHTATVKSSHCNLETVAFSGNEIALRDSHVIEHDSLSWRSSPSHFVFRFTEAKTLSVSRN